MLVQECMTENVEIASPQASAFEAAQMMRDGDYGFLPVGQDDRLVGIVTDRDIAIRCVAERKDPVKTTVGQIMSGKVLYCFEDQPIEEVAKNMGDNQVRRMVVLNRNKRLVGILSLGDIVQSGEHREPATEALEQISENDHREPQKKASA